MTDITDFLLRGPGDVLTVEGPADREGDLAASEQTGTVDDDLFDLEAHLPAGDVTWMDSALCAQTDPEVFFPSKGETARPGKSLCSKCEVRGECLDFALENNEQFGVWGGLSEHERREISTSLDRVPTTDDPVSDDTGQPAAHETRGEAA